MKGKRVESCNCKRFFIFLLILIVIAVSLRTLISRHNSRELEYRSYEDEDEVIKLIQRKPKYLCNEKDTEYNQKVLSYCLFGDGTRKNSGKGVKYRDYVKKVLLQAKRSEFYRTWKVRIYHDSLLNPDILEDHVNNNQVQFCNVENLTFYSIRDFHKLSGKFWRNIPIGDERVDAVCFRDLDSTLLLREEYAVDDWLKSYKVIHTMRDHPQHMIGMLAGMWCFRNSINRTLSRYVLEEILQRATTYHEYYYDSEYDDQPLLHKVVWEKHFESSVQHDAYTCKHFPNSKPFPRPRDDISEFVGCPSQPCRAKMPECPIECRPKDHPEWTTC